MDTKQKPEITRRDFLKASGTVTAVTLLGQNLFGDAPTPFSKHFSPTTAAGQDECDEDHGEDEHPTGALPAAGGTLLHVDARPRPRDTR